MLYTSRPVAPLAPRRTCLLMIVVLCLVLPLLLHAASDLDLSSTHMNRMGMLLFLGPGAACLSDERSISNALACTGCSATHSSFDWGCLPAPCMPRACTAAAGSSLTPLQAHPSRTSFSTLKSAPSSPPHGLHATIFSVELGAMLCNLLGCPPHLSPTARE